MKYARATRIFIFVVVCVIALYDSWVAAFGGSGDTISLQAFYMTGGAWEGKTLLFCVGYIMGHMFGRVDK